MSLDGFDVPGLQLLDRRSEWVWCIERAGRRCLAIEVRTELDAARSSSLTARVAQLAHADLAGFPKIRKLLEVGGRAFVVVDIVDGRSLAEVLQNGAVDPELARNAARDLANALARLHEVGVVFGPISASSVLINGGGQATFRDYGCAFQASVKSSGRWQAADASHVWTRTDDWASLDSLVDEYLSGRDPHQMIRRGQTGARPHERAPWSVGRRAELKRLRAAFLGLSGPSAVIVRGVPGIGKTHLIRAFRAEVDSNRCLHAAARRWDASPFGVVAQLVEGFLRPRADVEQERLGFLLTLPGISSQMLRYLSPALHDLIPVRGVQSTNDLTDDVYLENLVEAVDLLLREVSGAVIVEDVQWIDEMSRKLLRRIVNRANYPVLFVVTARSDLDEAFQALRFLGDLRQLISWEMDLERFDTNQSADLIEHYLRALPIAPQHAYALGTLGDGTPLGVLEIVRTVLDAGLLTPDWDRWGLDVSRVADLRLATKTTDLISQRVRRLSQSSIEVLWIASTLGGSFELPLLQRVSGCTDALLTSVVAEALRHHLVERTERESEYRIVHQSVIDALSLGRTPAEVKALHAAALSAICSIHTQGAQTWNSDLLFRAAEHATLADELAPTELALPVLVSAGRRAFESFDNARALRFFGAAERLNVTDEAEASLLAVWVAESQLRVGDLESSARRFERGLQGATEPQRRAQILARLAWVHEVQFDSDRAWSYLKEAFAELREPFPALNLASAPIVLRLFTADGTRLSKHLLRGAERDAAELVCTLLCQVCRLGAVRSDSGAVLASVARANVLARRIGISAALSRVNAMVSFVQTLIRRHRAAARAAELALSVAAKLNDPAAESNSLIVGSAVAIWRGDLDRSMELLVQCIRKHGSWLSPQDMGITASNVAILEGIRGRVRLAKPWLQRAAERALEYDGVASVVSETLYLCCRAASVHLGEDSSQGWWLDKLRDACRPIPRQSAYYLWTVGSRFRVLTEAGEFPAEADELVAWIESLALDPKRVHLAMTEYYVNVAHALVNRCLRQAGATAEVERLKRAAADLSKSARIRVIRAHSLVIEGYVHLFEGRRRRAQKRFEAAERLGHQEKSPWVLYAVERGRAHLARGIGQSDVARTRARAALQHAEENGAVHRAAWISQEFALDERQPRTLTARAPSSIDLPSGIDGLLLQRVQRGLLAIHRASSASLDAEQQAETVLDELIAMFEAERGYLFMSASGSRRRAASVSARDLRLLAARSASRVNVADFQSIPGQILERALNEHAGVCAEVPALGGGTLHILAAPLVLRGMVVGVACLESGSGRVPFNAAHAQLASALVSPLSSIFELTRVLRERERLAEDLQQAQKMEAVGRLAGGIAHDFNNMLAAICVSVESALSTSGEDSEHRADLETIRGAAERATRLTRQLLAFSRRQVVDARALDLNDTIRDIVPMLRRLLGRDVEIAVDLGRDVGPIKSDAAQLEQVLVNLAVNARDAMPGGGRLELSTREQDMESGVKADLEAGRYVVLSVKDDGVGMDRETQRRVFEPFFTTKDRESGTGLGLAMVYGIVRQNAGYIEFQSAPGLGTEFRIYLPRTRDAVQTLPPPALRTRASAARPSRILLVDDEPLVRHAFRRALSKLGYEVTVAASAREALQYVGQNPSVDLVITDVIMPAMSGVAMVEKMQRMGLASKVLYISGYTDGVLTSRVALGDSVQFVQKPISSDLLSEVVSRMLESADAEVPRGAS